MTGSFLASRISLAGIWDWANYNGETSSADKKMFWSLGSNNLNTIQPIIEVLIVTYYK